MSEKLADVWRRVGARHQDNRDIVETALLTASLESSMGARADERRHGPAARALRALASSLRWDDRTARYWLSEQEIELGLDGSALNAWRRARRGE